MNTENLQGSRKNIWYGTGRQRIEIPRSVLKNSIINNPVMAGMHIKSLGFYPKAKGHLSKREKGFGDNIIFYCVDGYGFYELNGERFTVAPNEFFILPQNVEHLYGSSDNNPWSIYWLHFGGANLSEFNRQMVVQSHFSPTHIKDNGEVVGLFQKMYKALELGYSIDNLLFANLCLPHFLSLFIYNGRHFPMPENKNLDSVDKAILYMQEHITE